MLGQSRLVTAAVVASLIVVCATRAEESSQGDSPRPKRKTPVKLPVGVTVERDITYRRTPDGELKLDVYSPEDFEGRLPVIVFIHGGGWKNGSKASAGRTAAWIVPEGYAVVGVQYRLTDVAQWPAQIEDCYAAVRWVREQADVYQFDAKRVGCWGTSAGAHLAALMGTRPCPNAEATSSRVQAVCDWFGPADLLTMPANTISEKRTFEQVAESNGAKLLGAPVPTIPEVAKDASALHQVTPDDAPILIMHGTEDPGVPFTQSERLANALKEAGVEHRLVPVDGAGHGGPEFSSDTSRDAVRSFFGQYLKKE